MNGKFKLKLQIIYIPYGFTKAMMDGWMDGWMDGQMDMWMDGWIEFFIHLQCRASQTGSNYTNKVIWHWQ